MVDLIMTDSNNIPEKDYAGGDTYEWFLDLVSTMKF